MVDHWRWNCHFTYFIFSLTQTQTTPPMSINQISEKEFLILYAEIHKVSIPDDKTCGNRPIFEKWMSTLPSGIIRNDSVHAYYSGLESTKTMKTPEIDLLIGNLGALQRWLDNWDVTTRIILLK